MHALIHQPARPFSGTPLGLHFERFQRPTTTKPPNKHAPSRYQKFHSVSWKLLPLKNLPVRAKPSPLHTNACKRSAGPSMPEFPGINPVTSSVPDFLLRTAAHFKTSLQPFFAPAHLLWSLFESPLLCLRLFFYSVRFLDLPALLLPISCSRCLSPWSSCLHVICPFRRWTPPFAHVHPMVKELIEGKMSDL